MDTPRNKKKQLKDIECSSSWAAWGEGNDHVDLALTDVGVSINEILNTPTCPEIIFKCWLEYWEVVCIKDRGDAAKHRLFNK